MIEFFYAELHDPQVVETLKREISRLLGDDIPIDTFVLLTGGTERFALEKIRSEEGPVFVIAHRTQNSFPAACELCSALDAEGVKFRLFLFPDDVDEFRRACRAASVLRNLRGKRIGILDEPSEWLVYASRISPDDIRDRLGMELVNISWSDFRKIFNEVNPSRRVAETWKKSARRIEDVTDEELELQARFYAAFSRIFEEYGLCGLTVKCFSMLSMYGSVPCLAFAQLNSEGVVMGCEGDIPALLGMIVGRMVSNKPVWMANVNYALTNGEIMLSHCTMTLDGLKSFVIKPHFESGKGAAVEAQVSWPSSITLLKVSPELELVPIRASLLGQSTEGNLCRTQLRVEIDPMAAITYFRERLLGNHTVIIADDVFDELEEMAWLLEGPLGV